MLAALVAVLAIVVAWVVMAEVLEGGLQGLLGATRAVGEVAWSWVVGVCCQQWPLP